MRIKTIVGLCILTLLLASMVQASESQELQLEATLGVLGISQSIAIIEGPDVTVDYVMPQVRTEADVMVQVQSIFIAAAKVAPESQMTVVKGRYSADTGVLIVVGVPTIYTKAYLADKLDLATYMKLWTVNDPDLVDAATEESGSVVWYALFAIIIAGIMFWYAIKKPKRATSKEHKVEKDLAALSKKQSILGWSHPKTSKGIQIVALIINIILPGVGYLFYGKDHILKAAIFFVSFVSLTAMGLVLLAFGLKIFVIADGIKVLIKD